MFVCVCSWLVRYSVNAQRMRCCGGGGRSSPASVSTYWQRRPRPRPSVTSALLTSARAAFAAAAVRCTRPCAAASSHQTRAVHTRSTQARNKHARRLFQVSPSAGLREPVSPSRPLTVWLVI